MPVIHLNPVAEVEILPSPVMFRVKSGKRFLKQLEDGEPCGFNEYATFTIDDNTGTFQCQSGFGDFAFVWPPHARSTDIFTFLASLGFDYFMNKAAKDEWELMDLERTIESLREEIRQERRGNRHSTDLSKDLANDIWDALDSIEADGPRNVDQFYHAWHQHFALNEWFTDYSPAIHTRIAPNAQAFWDQIWTVLINSPQFKAYMRKGKARA